MDLKGVGLLYHNDLHFDNLLYGGEQEEKRRASTENLVGIAGMTAAYKHASDHYQDNYQHVEKIRQAFLDSLTILMKSMVEDLAYLTSSTSVFLIRKTALS